MIAWAVAMLSPLVYYGVRTQMGELGYDMFPMFVSFPATFDLLWVVAPGAVVAALLLHWTLGPYEAGSLPRRLGAGVVLGGVLGWANAPVSVLLALVLSDRFPLDVWVRSLPTMLALSFPVAVPCGALLGFLVAAMGALEGPQSDDEKL